MRGFFGFIAFLLLIGLVAAVGVGIYNAGVSAGIASDIGSQISSGAQVPIVYAGPYVGQPWGGGVGFFGILFGIFFLFLIFGLLRAAFGWGRWGGHHGHGYGYGPSSKSWAVRHGGPDDYLDAWHRERHGEGTEGTAGTDTTVSPKPDTA